MIQHLHESASARWACGITDAIPSESQLSRFNAHLEHHLPAVEACLLRATESLQGYLPGLGTDVAIDSTNVDAFANPNRKRVIDPDAQWGVKHSARSKAKGKTDYFFGYKAHVLCDADYGIPLALRVTPGNKGDSTMLPPLLKLARENYPWLSMEHVIADRGYDSEPNHRAVVQLGAVPIIHIRDTARTKSLYSAVAGAPTCMGGVPMQYVRTNAEGHHLFRCLQEGCHLKPKSNGAWQYCDDEVWEDPFENLRVVGIVARQSERWQELYAKRSIIERLFGSLKQSRALLYHAARNLQRVTLHVNLSLLSYLGTVLARIERGEFRDLRTMRQAA